MGLVSYDKLKAYYDNYNIDRSDLATYEALRLDTLRLRLQGQRALCLSQGQTDGARMKLSVKNDDGKTTCNGKRDDR